MTALRLSGIFPKPPNDTRLLTYQVSYLFNSITNYAISIFRGVQIRLSLLESRPALLERDKPRYGVN